MKTDGFARGSVALSVAGTRAVVGRRRWLRFADAPARWGLTLALIGALVLFPRPAAAESPFIVAVAANTVALDPALATDDASALVATQLFDALLAYDDSNLLPTPGLAESWRVSDDGSIWTFYLRPGVTFHDGTPLTADAVVFNFQRWWDPANPYHQGDFVYFGALFGGFKGDANCLITDVRAVAPLQVQITLAHAYSAILSILAAPFFSIAAPAAIQAGTQAALPVGTGPFRFVAVAGDEVRMEANAAYWRGAPRSAGLVFKLMPDAGNRLAAVTAGTVQVAEDVLGPVGNPELRMHRTRTAASLGYLGINQDHQPFEQLLVRQAIAHAIDKAHILSAGYGDSAQAADQFLPPGMWGRDAGIADYGYDPALAKSLLAQAGYTSGITTTLAYRNVVRLYMPDPSAVAQTLKSDMEAAGIHLIVTEYESGEFLDKVYAGELDLFLLGWGADYPHPDNFFAPHFCQPAGLGPVDGTLCSRLDAARAADIEGQTEIYQWASRRIHDTVPLAPLANSTSWMARRFNVAGVTPSPLGLESYREAGVAGDSASAAPDAGETLSFVGPGDQTTSAEVPPGAVDQPTTFYLAEAGAASVPAGQAFAGHAFTLDAAREGALLEGFTFARPITLTVAYADADLVPLWEETLALYYWDGVGWSDVATTCSPNSTYALDPANNEIGVAICHLSHFALFGEHWPASYLPFVAK